ncbi:hypothetical protein K438DRAFT_1940956 [Mycena galopus ATCC 62051]|nr:hypothetical protein K438DRAFT_1940956 [Mycena galopus ATCC 62051]
MRVVSLQKEVRVRKNGGCNSMSPQGPERTGLITRTRKARLPPSPQQPLRLELCEGRKYRSHVNPGVPALRAILVDRSLHVGYDCLFRLPDLGMGGRSREATPAMQSMDSRGGGHAMRERKNISRMGLVAKPVCGDVPGVHPVEHEGDNAGWRGLKEMVVFPGRLMHNHQQQWNTRKWPYELPAPRGGV